MLIGCSRHAFHLLIVEDTIKRYQLYLLLSREKITRSSYIRKTQGREIVLIPSSKDLLCIILTCIADRFWVKAKVDGWRGKNALIWPNRYEFTRQEICVCVTLKIYRNAKLVTVRLVGFVDLEKIIVDWRKVIVGCWIFFVDK